MSGTECGSDSSSGAGIGKIFAANKDEEELQSDGSPGGGGDHRQHCIIIRKLMLSYPILITSRKVLPLNLLF